MEFNQLLWWKGCRGTWEELISKFKVTNDNFIQALSISETQSKSYQLEAQVDAHFQDTLYIFMNKQKIEKLTFSQPVTRFHHSKNKFWPCQKDMFLVFYPFSTTTTTTKQKNVNREWVILELETDRTDWKLLKKIEGNLKVKYLTEHEWQIKNSLS